jgi:hypothetical protein
MQAILRFPVYPRRGYTRAMSDHPLADKSRLALFLEAAGRLIRINAGELELRPRREGYRSWDETYAGDVHYIDKDGWVYVVFNDCASWDYIDRVEPPDGREPLDFSELTSGLIETDRKDETALWPSWITHSWCEPSKEQYKFWGLDEHGSNELPEWWS